MEKIFPTSSYQNGENPKEKVDILEFLDQSGFISRVRHVKTQSHVIDLSLTESRCTFDISNFGHIDHFGSAGHDLTHIRVIPGS